MARLDWKASDSLRDYYLAVFRPRALRKRNLRYLEKYDLAVREFVEFCGGKISLGMVSQELVDGYVANCLAISDRCEKYCRMLGGCIRTVFRSWNVFGLPKIVPLPPPEAGTVRHHFEEVYRVEAMIDCTEGAIENTRNAMRVMHNFFGRDLRLTEQSDALAASLFRHLRETHRAATINTKFRSTWFAVRNHAVDRGLIDRTPRIKKLREERDDPDAWTLKEFKSLVAAAGRFRAGEEYCGIPCNLWWQAALLILWWTAMRRKSLLSIRRENVDLEHGMITVEAGAMKNRRSKRYLIGPDAAAAVGAIWLPERELLLPVKNQRGLYDAFGDLVTMAGIRKSRRKTVNKFHMVRRTVATAVHARAGMAAASALLGHSDAYVTMRYIDPNQTGALGVTRILPAICEDLPRLNAPDSQPAGLPVPGLDQGAGAA